MKYSRREFIARAVTAALPLTLPYSFRPLANAGFPVRFELAGKECGLDFILASGASGRMYQVETLLGGLGVIDFDGDGWPDLYCSNGAALPSLEKTGPAFWNRLYRNNRDGTFSDVTEKAGVAGRGYAMAVAVADYDNDGHEDLFVAGVHGNQLFHNNGNGTFSDVTEKAGLAGAKLQKYWSISAAWIDYDNDGHLDLFISNYCDWDAAKDPVCAEYCHPDVYRAQAMQLFHNNGDGTFTEVNDRSVFPQVFGKGMGIALADFAGDNRTGFFVANDNARNLLFHPDGKGLRELGIEAGVAYNSDGRSISGMGADFGDIDGDGRPDIVMTGLRGETFEVFLNREGGSFDDGSVQTGLLALSKPWSGWGCGLVDLDNDGSLDLFVATGGFTEKDSQANRVFRNIGGKFADVSDKAGVGLAMSARHRGVAFADFDRDGRLDAAVTAIGKRIELWWNRSEKNHWLQIRLCGNRSNRSSIGAQVFCRSAGRSQMRCVSSSVGYASSSDLTAHFGLGSDSSAEIEIRWPSGTVQKIGWVDANRRLQIEEPA